MVKKMSDNIADYISNELNYDSERKEILSYGIEIFLGESLKIISIIVLSLILNIFSYTLIAMVSFMIFRTVIGGAHNSTYARCFLTSVLWILLIGFLGKNFYFITENYQWLAFLVLGLAVIFTIIWVPAGTEKKTIKNKALRYKMKIISFILLVLWITLILWSQDSVNKIYTLSSILGVSSTFFLVTPPAYTLMKKI